MGIRARRNLPALAVVVSRRLPHTLRRIDMLGRSAFPVGAALLSTFLLGSGCSDAHRVVDPPSPEAGPVSFENDAGTTDPNSFSPLCAATTCPPPYGTCSDDLFLCETN